MPFSFELGSLRLAYLRHEVSPVSVIREVTARIAARGNDAVWISRVPDDVLLAEAAALERRADRDELPLYGIPFAVKDNIDAAGLPTTAGCPEFAYMPARSAPVLEYLRRAGALLVGKTNLDQFATGLVGTRTPYGIPQNPFDPAYIPGGSSSGSAVAVAAGLVSFALGTDTAGSGRVPAALNNIVGLKPSRGVISTEGIVPACPSLDCVSIFALTLADGAAVLDVVRPRAAATMPTQFVFGVPGEEQPEIFGNAAAAALFDQAIARLTSLSGHARRIDFAPFLAAGSLVYNAPFLAERRDAIDTAIRRRRDILHPVTREIIEGADAMTPAAVADGRRRLALLAAEIEPIWRDIDVLLVPTAGTTSRIADVLADPFGPNANLGRYTNFANPLGLAAVAVPAGFQPDGLPFGVTLLAPALRDPLLIAVAGAFAGDT